MKLIEDAKNYTINQIEEQFIQLENYCSKYPEIDVFVTTILELIGAGMDSRKYTPEQRLASAVCELLDEFNNSNIRSNLAYKDSYNFNGDWIRELNSFIGYHILDDGGLVFRNDGLCNKWKMHSYDGISGENYTQNPLAIIAAARDNMNFEIKLHKFEDDLNYFYRQGMVSSGKVEKYILTD